jgi:serine/threonine protein kinase
VVEGTSFGRYQLLEVLGQGGMGQVFRAYDTATERIVAVKLLPPEVARDGEFQRRFRREAQIAARLTEPHVVPIHNFGEIDGRLYVDMRLIEGRDLDRVLADGPLDPSRAVSYIEQVATALDSAHQAGLVHRDVKPSNVLIGARDFAYLIDFGIARAADATKLTSTGNTIGTLAYMAPERFDTGEADHRSDVYSLTCVLCQCLTGRRPYAGESIEQQIKGHLVAPAPRPSAVNPGIPSGFDDVIAKGMAKDPGERYQSTLELAVAARDALDPTALQPLTLQAPIRPGSSRAADGDRRPIRGVHDSAATEETVPASTGSQQTQRIEPGRSATSGRRRRWIVATIGVIVLLGGVAVSTAVLLPHHGAKTPKAAPGERVRLVIQQFDLAVHNGNLAGLRRLSCGATHARYEGYSEASWAQAQAQAKATKEYPVIVGIDGVTVDGDQAQADVTEYMAADPQTRSTRTFELQFLDGRWKVCSDGAE